jgi:hypothetical protein
MPRVGRPERPLHTTTGPLAELAGTLRRLRGSRTYRELAVVTGLSVATLRTAAAGEQLPTWKVTRVFTAACGGEELLARELWETACAAAGRPVPDDYLPGEPPVPGIGEAVNAAQLIEMMKQLRMWAGNPSLAELNRRSGGLRLPPSTVSDMLRIERLPRAALMLDFVRACGLDENQTTAWERALDELKAHELTAAQPFTARQLTELGRDLRASAEAPTETTPPRRALPADGQVCALLAVDIAGFTGPHRDDDIRLYLHEELYRVLHRAFDGSGIPWADCFYEDRGDGALIVVPPGVPAKGIIDPLPERLRGLIRRHNHVSRDVAHIQLRVAAHIGPIYHDGHGFFGTDINLLFRMLEARPLKVALAGSGAELALIVSEYVYHSLVCRYPSLVSPDAFRAVRFQVKYTRAHGWTYLPGPKLTTNGDDPL